MSIPRREDTKDRHGCVDVWGVGVAGFLFGEGPMIFGLFSQKIRQSSHRSTGFYKVRKIEFELFGRILEVKNEIMMVT